MHIIFFTDNFPPEVNATASRVFERARYWIQWGYEVTIITSAPNFPEGRLHPGYKNKWYQVEYIEGMRVVRVKTFIKKNTGIWFRILDFLSYMVMAFLGAFLQKTPEMVVASSPHFFVAISAWFYALFKRKPFVLELADLWPASISAVGAVSFKLLLRLIEKFELFLYRRANRIVVLTKAFKANLIARGINPDKICVVRNGVELGQFKPIIRDVGLVKQYNLENKFIISYIGTHGMAHDLVNVLKAAKMLESNQKIMFMFVGAGAEREVIIDRAKKMNLTNILFIPLQSKQVIKKFWSITDVALVHLRDSPTFKEVIPSKIFEAMAMAKPLLLVSPDGEAREIVEEHHIGCWVPAGEPEKLVTAVRELFNNPCQCKSYAKNSLESVIFHTREQQARLFSEVFQSYDCSMNTKLQKSNT